MVKFYHRFTPENFQKGWDHQDKPSIYGG